MKEGIVYSITLLVEKSQAPEGSQAHMGSKMRHVLYPWVTSAATFN